jgi:Mn-dependent DtxR family transcriptional regulator
VDVWKEFDQNVVTHSAAHHLMAIAELVQKLGYARVSDVARELNITRGSVSISLQPLKKAGFVVQDENRHLRLSEAGQALVDAIRTKRRAMTRFFAELLGVAPEQAEIDACKLEHLVSHETARRLVSFLRYLDSGKAPAREFFKGWAGFDPSCGHEPASCPSCGNEGACLENTVAEQQRLPRGAPPRTVHNPARRAVSHRRRTS